MIEPVLLSKAVDVAVFNAEGELHRRHCEAQ